MLMIGFTTVLMTGGDEAAFAAEPPADAVRSDSPKPGDKATDKKLRPELSESELTLTMGFAAEHHPELARLLDHLKKSRPSEFQRAVRELNQQIQTLEKLREKNPARYAHQLELWKNDSQIRVLVAKWSRTQDDELEQEIRGLLQQRRDLKLAQLKAEQQRLTEQMQKLEKQIATLSDSQLEREWEQLAKKTNASRKAGSKDSPN
jgi:septal ring factor EnvC (AmiA/AmiB activator)